MASATAITTRKVGKAAKVSVRRAERAASPEEADGLYEAAIGHDPERPLGDRPLGVLEDEQTDGQEQQEAAATVDASVGLEDHAEHEEVHGDR